MSVVPPPLEDVDYPIRRLGLTKDRIWELCRRGAIPFVKIGRTYRFDPRQIEDWIANGGNAADRTQAP